MLLHAALWLNARTTTRRTMGELRGRTQHALDRGALALFAIAFLAMFRETFETTVFLEALSIDAPSAVVWGASSGSRAAAGLVFAVSRLGLRLPMTTLFKISTVVLVVTAVVLLGQGIHSFEEVGILPSRPMPFLRIEFLGIYPDQIGLLAQLAVALAPILWKARAAWPKVPPSRVRPIRASEPRWAPIQSPSSNTRTPLSPSARSTSAISSGPSRPRDFPQRSPASTCWRSSKSCATSCSTISRTKRRGSSPSSGTTCPRSPTAVDRLAEAHDTICGAVVRLVHLVRRDLVPARDHAALVAHCDRFESAYAQHSQKEAALFEALGRALDEHHRAELAEILRGL